MTGRHAKLRRLDAAAWSCEARAFADHGYRQLPAFNEACAARMGAACEHVAIEREGGIAALALVRVRTIPVVGGGIAYINGGPLVRRAGDHEQDAAALGCALETLIDHYVRGRGLTLRLKPPLGDTAWHELQAMILGLLGFRPAPRGGAYRTVMLDLSRTPDELRAALAPKWRQGLAAARRHDLEIVAGTDPALLNEFTALHERMRRTKGFHVDLPAALYAGVQTSLAENDRFEVMLARANGTVVAGHVGSHLGDTSVYLLGATDETGRRTKAAYLLQWWALRRARARGARWYDLGGIDPIGNPGVYRFKQRMGGEERLSAGTFEFRPRSLRRLATAGAERAYAALRRLARSSRTAVMPDRA